ncbi:MAG: AAA family ATPase [Bacilli bacterium]|nr:AAA family ATPase [Bacilli bacterium]
MDRKFSVLDIYGDVLTEKKYITNPAIARDEELKRLMLTLLTPEKSALLIGKAGIGKTAIVEGLAYLIQNNNVPEVLKGYKIIKINSSSLLGKVTLNNQEELLINIFVDEVKKQEKTIIFIDEIHTLIGARGSGPMDLANILKPILDRGETKVIGATTTAEYETYIIRDRAFLRRFEKIEILEPDEETTTTILLGSLKKIEAKTGIKFKYNDYVAKQVMASIVSATSEFKRVYGLAAMYPDIAFSVLMQSFSEALFQNRKEVNILDVYNAIKHSKRIYPDSIVKELEIFRNKFTKLCNEENIILPVVTIEEVQRDEIL